MSEENDDARRNSETANGLLSQLFDAQYSGKRVLVTGHTGFKGGWLALWLHYLGATVTGFALPPLPSSFFDSVGLKDVLTNVEGDVRDLSSVSRCVEVTQPDFIFHLAAQSIVRKSYDNPLETIATNIVGTANLLEAIRHSGAHDCIIVIVTSDKCYENREWPYAYRENDPMGGHDVYSMSKGATELLVASYRRSFFSKDSETRRVGVATARAGNVIGGGDWSPDRIVPDTIRAIKQNSPVIVRNPRAVRPWQHVLEPLSGYLELASHMAVANGASFRALCDAWNFGPRTEDSAPVETVVSRLIEAWGHGSWTHNASAAVHEAQLLRLSIDKAVHELKWVPRWSLQRAVDETVSWYKQHENASASELREFSRNQISEYCSAFA